MLTVIALLLLAGYLVVKTVGERYLQQIIQAELQRQRLPVTITIEQVQIGFPLQVVLKRVACAIVQSPPESVFSAERIVVNPQLVGFMMGRVVLDSIRVEQPSLVLTRHSEQAWNITPLLPQAPSATVAGEPSVPAAAPRPLLLEVLRLDDGTVAFTDETVVPAFHGELRHLDLEVKKLPIPVRAITTSFEATGEWAGPIQNQRSPLTVHGWLDLSRKKGEVNGSLHDLDVTTLEPYFGKKLITKLYAGLLNVEGQATLNGSNEVLVKLDLDLRDLQISGGDLTLETLQAQTPALGTLVTALQQNQSHVTQHLELNICWPPSDGGWSKWKAIWCRCCLPSHSWAGWTESS
ncbi:MAG: DUF748 domain-containing protein [Candidatus Omnitrophica bacterium]|nr:DUF748 domain-containing protein [Candidatus Omnitrophota bacterium]